MKPERKVHGWFQNEQGDWSLGRALLVTSLAITFALIVADSILTAVDVPPDAYALLTAVFIGLLGWVGGPRIARYLLPQLAGTVKGVAAAANARPPRVVLPEDVD